MAENTKQYANFEEFYPFYLSQHSNIINRRLHIIGTILACMILLLSYLFHTNKYLLLVPLAGYGFAWIGHFCVEKNRPATFRHPLYSLMGDFRMVYDSFTGKLKI